MYFVTRPSWGRVAFDAESRSPWLRVPFGIEEYRDRWQQVAKQLSRQSLDALIIAGTPGNSAELRYLSNFDSYAGATYLIITREGECSLATNSLMRAEPMQTGIWTTHVEDVRVTWPQRYDPTAPSLEQLALDILSDYGIQRGAVGVCGPVNRSGFADALQERPVELVDFSAALSDIVAVKSPAEIRLLRDANKLVSEIFAAVSGAVKIGVTERELAGIASGTMMAGGAEGTAFSLALVAGERSGLKHVLPTDYAIRDGDILFMDLGMVFEGYVTDNSRSALVGSSASGKREFVEAAEEMTEAAISMALPGVAQSALDDAAFAVAEERGFREDYYFRAHGVGTSLFQKPRFFPGDDAPLQVNEVFSIEPMLVRLGFGTACVERTVLMTEHGAEVLDAGPGIWLCD